MAQQGVDLLARSIRADRTGASQDAKIIVLDYSFVQRGSDAAAPAKRG